MQATSVEPTAVHTIAELAGQVADDVQLDANLRAIADLLVSLEPEDIALALEALPLERRLIVWRQVPEEVRLDTLVAMRGESRLLLLQHLADDELPRLFDGVEAEDLLELGETLPGSVIDLALTRMDAQQRGYYDMAQQFSDESVGRWMNHDVLIVSQNTRVAGALRLLRREAPDYTEVLYLVNRTGRWAGCVRINELIRSHGHHIVSELKEEDYPSLTADMNVYEAAEQVERSGFVALPVLNQDGVLIGRLDVGTAVELTREQAETQLMSSAGLAEDTDLFAPVKRSAQGRAVWLGINLLTAFLASWFIGLFEATIQQVVALAVLMPVVASMGGIAGSQTLTLIVRGLALKQISSANFRALLSKEIRVGLLNGVLWALVIGTIAKVWFGSVLLGLVIACAIVVNILAAALAGVLVPVVLDRWKIDPALSGSVILTTVTDVVGFVAFLGLGSLILL